MYLSLSFFCCVLTQNLYKPNQTRWPLSINLCLICPSAPLGTLQFTIEDEGLVLGLAFIAPPAEQDPGQSVGQSVSQSL